MTTRRDLLAGAGLAALVAQLPVIALAQPKDSVTIAMTLEPPTLDPTSGAAQAIREVTLQNIFEGLVRMDRAGKIVPCLAESWEVAADNVTYRFKLRTNATFHDGTPFTSELVKFSFERAVAPDSTNAQRQLFAPIAAIETPDPVTVVITLKQPTANFLYGLAWGDAVIVAPASAANNKTSPVGTGPFKFVRWNRGDRLELARNDAYWGAKPALAKATFRFISDPAAQVASLRAADVDAQTNLAAPEAVAQLRADPKLKVAFGKTEGEVILATNNAKPPFNDLRVRQAIAHVLDRKTIALGVYGFDVDLIGSHFSPLHPAYVDLTNTYPPDLAKAKALLAQAGHPNGFTCTLSGAAAGLCAPLGRDHRGAAGANRHQCEDRAAGVPAMAGAGVPGQGFRPQRDRPYRAARHRQLCPRRLLLPVPEPRVQGADRKDRRDAAGSGAKRALWRGAAHPRPRRGQRLSLRAAEDHGDGRGSGGDVDRLAAADHAAGRGGLALTCWPSPGDA